MYVADFQQLFPTAVTSIRRVKIFPKRRRLTTAFVIVPITQPSPKVLITLRRDDEPWLKVLITLRRDDEPWLHLRAGRRATHARGGPGGLGQECPSYILLSLRSEMGTSSFAGCCQPGDAFQGRTRGGSGRNAQATFCHYSELDGYFLVRLE